MLIAFSANLWGKEQIVEMIYVIFIPFLCNLIILIWNGEVRRMSRAGQYIKNIEEKVHNELSSKAKIDIPALEWETFLRNPKASTHVEKVNPTSKNRINRLLKKDSKKDNKIKSNYIAIIMMFGGLSMFSISLGFVHNYSMYRSEKGISFSKLNDWLNGEFFWIIVYILLLIIDFFIFVYHYRYFQKVKK